MTVYSTENTIKLIKQNKEIVMATIAIIHPKSNQTDTSPIFFIINILLDKSKYNF